MIFVKATLQDNADSLIKKFQKKSLDEDIVGEATKRRFYEKPSITRMLKTREIKKRRGRKR